MGRQGQCRCGNVLEFELGPEGYKMRCPKCRAVVRLREESPSPKPPGQPRYRKCAACGAYLNPTDGQNALCVQCRGGVEQPTAPYPGVAEPPPTRPRTNGRPSPVGEQGTFDRALLARLDDGQTTDAAEPDDVPEVEILDEDADIEPVVRLARPVRPAREGSNLTLLWVLVPLAVVGGLVVAGAIIGLMFILMQG